MEIFAYTYSVWTFVGKILFLRKNTETSLLHASRLFLGAYPLLKNLPTLSHFICLLRAFK